MTDPANIRQAHAKGPYIMDIMGIKIVLDDVLEDGGVLGSDSQATS
jgi:hypothetical protein